jgi:apolipoprotein N-acyltransferase
MAGMPWLSAVGLAWWASGVALLFRRGPGGMLVLAVLVLLLEVVPALVLRHRKRAGAARS